VVAAVVTTAALGVMARGDGYRASRVDLSGGGAWLASVQQGLLTLIDGASEQVVGSLPVSGAGPGDERGRHRGDRHPARLVHQIGAYTR
jgi:hypothetical protein